MNSNKLINNLVDHLKKIKGIKAIVLGGSRARGTHSEKSDIDIGIYYECAKELDVIALNKLAAELDDLHRQDLITNIGEWGPWINGGGWLTITNYPVDFLYGDIKKISAIIDKCLQGNITMHYQPGHPHGFADYIYVSQIAICSLLWDPEDIIAHLKRKMIPYSPLLKKAIIEKFFWEAEFAALIAQKAVDRLDNYYISGCLFRSISCIVQVLFALNECYWMNEKGSIAFADSFKIKPHDFQEKVNHMFSLMNPDIQALSYGIEIAQGIIAETHKLIA
jgi:predicted nucleotidyltransferase